MLTIISFVCCYSQNDTLTSNVKSLENELQVCSNLFSLEAFNYSLANWLIYSFDRISRHARLLTK